MVFFGGTKTTTPNTSKPTSPNPHFFNLSTADAVHLSGEGKGDRTCFSRPVRITKTTLKPRTVVKVWPCGLKLEKKIYQLWCFGVMWGVFYFGLFVFNFVLTPDWCFWVLNFLGLCSATSQFILFLVFIFFLLFYLVKIYKLIFYF